jgi:hypothetical protein
MTSPSSPTLEQPTTDDVVVAALNNAFQLPSFGAPRAVDPTPEERAPQPMALSELVALALFAILTVGSVVLVVVSLAD